MTQWLHERYILRDEHQKIVAYYRKLVAQLHGKVRELQAETDLSIGSEAAEGVSALAAGSPAPAGQPDRIDNVIRVEFRGRSTGEAGWT